MTTPPTPTPHEAQHEAEAALLALKPQLEWEEFGGPQWETPYLNDAGDFYSIVAHPTSENDTNYQATFLPVCFPVETPHRYDSLAEAKAACERHYATGKWE
jgi:hypothetical protein